MKEFAAMGVNKLVFAALIVGCLAAAGLGGYLAVRQSTPASAAGVSEEQPAPAPAVAPATPVTESEGIIAPEPPEKPAGKDPALQAPRAEAAAPRKAPAARREPAPREAPAPRRPDP